MLKRQHTRHATRGTIPYLAGQYLHKHGSMSKEELFAAVSFGQQKSKREDVLNRAIQAGWLAATLDGKIACRTDACLYYDSLEAKLGSATVGEPTAPAYRGNVFGPALSKRYVPDRRGPRADVPAWSVREPAPRKGNA